MSDLPTLRRDDLAQFFGSNPRFMSAMERHGEAVQEVTGALPDTQALKDATVIVLSANGDFTNERILQIGDGIDIEVTDSTVRLSVKDVARTKDFGATFVPPAEVLLFLPPEGTLLSDVSFANLGNYASNAAAVAAGLAVGALYRTGGAVMVVT